jgi:hypothetical protein
MASSSSDPVGPAGQGTGTVRTSAAS